MTFSTRWSGVILVCSLLATKIISRVYQFVMHSYRVVWEQWEFLALDVISNALYMFTMKPDFFTFHQSEISIIYILLRVMLICNKHFNPKNRYLEFSTPYATYMKLRVYCIFQCGRVTRDVFEELFWHWKAFDCFWQTSKASIRSNSEVSLNIIFKIRCPGGFFLVASLKIDSRGKDFFS